MFGKFKTTALIARVRFLFKTFVTNRVGLCGIRVPVFIWIGISALCVTVTIAGNYLLSIRLENSYPSLHFDFLVTPSLFSIGLIACMLGRWVEAAANPYKYVAWTISQSILVVLLSSNTILPLLLPSAVDIGSTVLFAIFNAFSIPLWIVQIIVYPCRVGSRKGR